MLTRPSPRIAFLIGSLVLLLLGCGSDGPAAESEWTIQEDALTLDRTLRVSDGESYYFGAIYDIAVGPKGKIYVADGKAGHVKILNRKGRLMRTIGRSGEGPGEFRRPANIGFTGQDSLYVMGAYRASVFGPPNHNFQYSFRPIGKESSGVPRDMMVKQKGGGALFAFLPFPKTITKTDAKATIRPVSSNGTVGDALIAARPRQTSPEGNTFPFSRRPAFALGPSGAVHHVWSGNLRVLVYDQSGMRKDTIRIPFDDVPVAEQERDSVLRDLPTEKQNDIRRHIPSTKPAFTQFLIDDRGHYWFGRPTANPDSTNWWVAWPDEKRVVTTTLPSEVELAVVKSGHAYGETTTENGAPAVVRYRVRVTQ